MILSPNPMGLMAQYRHLPTCPENIEVLAALKAKGIATGMWGIGKPAMLDAAVASPASVLRECADPHTTRA